MADNCWLWHWCRNDDHRTIRHSGRTVNSKIIIDSDGTAAWNVSDPLLGCWRINPQARGGERIDASVTKKSCVPTVQILDSIQREAVLDLGLLVVANHIALGLCARIDHIIAFKADR